ncbi:apicoplast-associated thioredoxin family protein atrx1 [Cystoisospora suis]|uniref:Apicoplast-associated thioredoxin family protein atrx1 n=1 Tax=Cystoisospora suis TaxID=483139 RepID=A0A2C6KH97_9APIC|nr:apicoplast-associated thioredoxin family protein atrx1 [Cystoisospora suis]
MAPFFSPVHSVSFFSSFSSFSSPYIKMISVSFLLFFFAASLEKNLSGLERSSSSSFSLLSSQAFVLEPSPPGERNLERSPLPSTAYSASHVLGDLWMNDEEEGEKKRNGLNRKRRVVAALQEGTAIDSSSDSSFAYGDEEDHEERNHVEEKDEEHAHSNTSPGVHTPDEMPGRSGEDSKEMWDRERKEQDFSSPSSSSLLRTSPVVEPSGEQVTLSERQGERTPSGVDSHQPKSYSARVYVHRNETSPRWNDKRENSAACKGGVTSGGEERVEKERRERKDHENVASEGSRTTTESLESSIRKHSIDVSNEGDLSSQAHRREEGRNSLKNRKAMPAFFKSSSSSSSSSTSSYTQRGRSRAMSYSTYDEDDEEEEEFLTDDEDASSFGGRGDSGTSRALNFFKRKLRHAVTCPAAKILLGLGGIVALGSLGIKYTQEILKKRRRQRLEDRPSTPFTDLLGYVLLTHERKKSKLSSSFREGGRRDQGGGEEEESLVSSSTIEVSTADVLPSGRKRSPSSPGGSHPTVTALYFTGSAVEEMLETRGYVPFTPRLKSIAEGCRAKGQDLRVVYVSADSNVKDAEKHFSQMPWYAVPYDDAKGREIAQKLYRRFRVSTLPQLVLLNEEGEVVNPQAYASMLMNPADFPWKKKTIKELLGDTLLQHDGKIVSKDEVLKGEKKKKRVIGLYFSASWCPPCQNFTPKLVETLKLLKERKRKEGEEGENEEGGEEEEVEVIFVSNDKDETQFNEYFKKMDGFYAIPYTDTNRRAILQEALNIRSLPTLIWIRETPGQEEEGEGVAGDEESREKEREEILTKRGVQAVMEDREALNFPWRDKEIHDVSETVEGLAEEPVFILFTEYADEKSQMDQQKELEEAAIALKSQKNDGKYPPLPRLFTAKKLTPRSIALRRICKQEPSSSSSTPSSTDSLGGGRKAKDPPQQHDPRKPVMVILDLIDQSYYVYEKDKKEEGSTEETSISSSSSEKEGKGEGHESSGMISSQEIVRFIHRFRSEQLSRQSLAIPEP